MLNSVVNRFNLTGLSARIRRMKDRLYRERIMFVHVPKSGGTSLSHALRARYPLSYFKLSEEAATVAGQGLSAGQWMALKRRIASYSAETGAHYVQGHFPIDRTFLDTYAGRYHLITLLREPVDRVISHYFFDKRLRRMSFEEFLASPRGFVETRVLALFFGELDWDDPQDPEAATERAIANLERFAVVGILEDQAAFHRALAARTGIRIAIPRRNVGEHRADAAIDPELRRHLAALCAGDIRIYEHFRARGAGLSGRAAA